MKILIIYGTRPEKIKMLPVIHALEKRNVPVVVYETGQHVLSGTRMVDGNNDFDYFKMLSHALEIAKDSSYILVQGDTTSTLLGALTALYSRKRLGHIEAGLRSYDQRMIEEKIRCMVDHMADDLFAPTNFARETLEREDVSGNIVLTGNPIIDMLRKYAPAKLADKYIVVTLHRPENVDDKNILTEKIMAIETLRKIVKKPLIFPIHPRTKNALSKFKLSIPESWKVVDPLPFSKMINLLGTAHVVLTDSGGIQEECCYLRKPTITLRVSTERPETLDLSNLVADSREEILMAYKEVIKLPFSYKDTPYGDGTAGKKIADYICELQ